MGIPRVDKCCFCATVETGVLVIGYLKLVTSIIVIIFFTFSLMGLSLLSALINMPADEQGNVHLRNGQVLNHDQIVVFTHVQRVGTIIFIGYVIGGVISAAMAILLVVGGHKKNPRLLNVYWRIAAVFLAIYLVFEIISLCLNPTPRVIGALLGMALDAYFIVVIRSAALKATEENPGGVVYSTPQYGPPQPVYMPPQSAQYNPPPYSTVEQEPVKQQL